MNADQAKFLAEYLTGLIERESAMTAKVLEAVPDTGHDYKPDAKSRTAWELATHLATADVWFLQSVIDGAFKWDPEGAKQAVAQFGSVKDVVAALGLKLAQRPSRFVAFMPEALENELFRMEKGYVEKELKQKFDEARIEETRFRVVLKKGKYQPEIVTVVLKK